MIFYLVCVLTMGYLQDISVSTRANYLDIKESARMALNILDDS